MADVVTDTLESYVDYWSIHSTKDRCPTYRGWAESEEAAQARLEEIRADDGNTEDAYWILQMTESELEAFQAMGDIPRGA